MLKIRIISPGKDKEPWITQGCEHYRTLLSRSVDIEFVYLAVKSSASLPPEEVKAREYDQFARHLGKGPVVALDMRGKAMDSRAFARFIDRYQTTSKGQISFLLGGAYGLDDRLVKGADAVISLSQLTFSHQLVRLIFMEQLYRAFSILGGSPYHK